MERKGGFENMVQNEYLQFKQQINNEIRIKELRARSNKRRAQYK